MKLRSLALAAMLFAGLPLASSHAHVGISVQIAPPALPIYAQPYCPVEGYIWTPGYWGYEDVGYYWVPGVWVAPPRVGFLWTPGYWGYEGGGYGFHNGYWGSSVGFYGGINYGFGYVGSGYYGGEWAGGRFRYNTAFSRVNTTIIRNTYVNKTVIKNNKFVVKPNGASFNGGPGGVKAQANKAQQEAAAQADKTPPTPAQQKVRQAAAKNPEFRADNNKGNPKRAALSSADEAQQISGGAAADKPGQNGPNGNDGANGKKGAGKKAALNADGGDVQNGGAAGDNGRKGDGAANDGAARPGKKAAKIQPQDEDSQPANVAPKRKVADRPAIERAPQPSGQPAVNRQGGNARNVKAAPAGGRGPARPAGAKPGGKRKGKKGKPEPR
ncbi:MAG: YXWGXW repeat-containing protein [Chthoniobacterales bacterium]